MPVAPRRQSKTELSSLASSSRRLSPRSAKREAIIASAKEMFFLEGYSGASMDRITAGAAVSKATVYSYFRSKEELLVAVVEAVVTPVKRDYLEGVDPRLDIESWLLTVGKLLARQVLLPDVTSLERLVIAEAIRFPELGKTFQSIAIDGSLKVLRPRVEAAIASGELHPCNPDDVLRRFAEMCASSLHRRVLHNEGPMPAQDEIDRHIKQMVELFLYGCTTPKFKRMRSGLGDSTPSSPDPR